MNKKINPKVLVCLILVLAVPVGFYLLSSRNDQVEAPGEITNSTSFVNSLFKGIFSSPDSKEKTTRKSIPKKPDQTLVTVASEEDLQTFSENNDLSDSDLIKSNSLPNTYIVKKPKNELNGDKVSLASRNRYSALYSFSNQDPIYPQWYTTKISANNAWDYTTGSSDTTVAVIDTGFALNHEDLDTRWADGGYDFLNNDADPSAGQTNQNGDAVSHGTMVAGLVGATGNNGLGVASINWQTKILPLQVLSDDGYGWTDDVAAAINYAVDQGVDVINMSLGSPDSDSLLKTAIDNAVESGVTVVAAAGNCGNSSYVYQGCDYQGQITYPAKYSTVIAVGATNSSDSRASYSSYGSELDIVAPGDGAIRSTMWAVDNQTAAYNSILAGTSFSSPIVSGAAALLIGEDTSLSPAEVRDHLINSAYKTPGMSGATKTSYYGYGRLDINRSIRNSLSWPGDSRSFRLIECQDGNKYLVERGIRAKRLLTNGSISAWNLSDSYFSTNDRGCSYRSYSISLDRTIRSRNTKRIYLIDNRKAYKLQSYTISKAWGLEGDYTAGLSELPQMNGTTIHELDSISNKLPRVVLSIEDSRTYLLDSGNKYYLNGSPDDNASKQLLVGGNIPTGSFSDDLLSTLPSGTEINYSLNVNSTYYLLDFGSLKAIDPAYLDRWLALVSDSPELSTDILPRLADSGTVSTGFTQSGTYYFIGEDGSINSLSGAEEATSLGVNSSPEISSVLLSKLVTP